MLTVSTRTRIMSLGTSQTPWTSFFTTLTTDKGQRTSKPVVTVERKTTATAIYQSTTDASHNTFHTTYLSTHSTVKSPETSILILKGSPERKL